ncbi:GMC oxidoreductase [Maritimibacter dapengensis]|uniref:GMC family oxidoreductase n=1 Tax=Maritimibacter dapengensis TaxID=2836868 RepID=A0ABS6T3F5_9RHOB|nr:GMC family oxidoreductase [Maritimibacter dapengensis]MBV7379794.1 GMC family oxidoreductase [Maritimibacter dapengensis]
MFLEPKTFPSDHVESAQICVFGSGPAGLTLAQDLARRGVSVLLVEAGGLYFEDWSQQLYAGSVVGDAYYDLAEARLRMFGGTSNHWGGRCIPLDSYDFEPHPGFPETGWPISKGDLDPYLAGACEVVEITNDFKVEQYTENVVKNTFQYSAPVLFGEKYMEFCESSDALKVCLETALIDLEPEGDAIRHATVRTRDGETWRIQADNFVMCLGGIENSRMLLWFDEQHGGALNANRDVLGAYWMEHPHANLADVVFRETGEGFFKDGEATFALTREAQVSAGILNAGLQMTEAAYGSGSKQLIADLLCVAPGLGARILKSTQGKALVCGSRLESHWEQAPVRTNRVALGDETDALGIPRPQLHWRRSEQDRLTATMSTLIFAQDLAQADLGRARLAEWIAEDGAIPNGGMIAGWHHMGGTRMHDSPSHGVVDKNLKVHKLQNLYIGGSSVFPTGGYANPTLTIVQMSLRLADHLATLV